MAYFSPTHLEMFAAVLLRRDRALTAIAVALDIAFHAGRGGALAGAAEVADNPRAASARLRAAVRITERGGPRPRQEVTA